MLRLIGSVHAMFISLTRQCTFLYRGSKGAIGGFRGPDYFLWIRPRYMTRVSSTLLQPQHLANNSEMLQSKLNMHIREH